MNQEDIWNAITALMSIVAVVISGIACFQSKKANHHSKKANKLANQANEQSKEANLLAKNYQYASLLLDLYSTQYISKAVFFFTSPKLFEKHIERLAKKVRNSRKEYKEAQVEVIFDYIIDYSQRKIYEWKDNPKKKAAIQSIYQIVEELELLLPFIEKTNPEEYVYVTDFIKQAKTKSTETNCQLINNFGHSFNHPQATFFEKKYKEIRSKKINDTLSTDILAFAWGINALDEINKRECATYDFSKRQMKEAVDLLKAHYGDYYIYQDVRTAYRKSLVYKKGGNGHE